MPRKKTPAVVVPRSVFVVDWPLFGELSRALALRVARAYDPEIVVGIATAGVVPGAAVAAILDRPFHSMLVSRRHGTASARKKPTVFDSAPAQVAGQRVLIVDETCDSGETLKLAVAAMSKASAADVRTAVSFKTGDFEPDFYALETVSTIVLPWDKEILVDGELVRNPKYE